MCVEGPLWFKKKKKFWTQKIWATLHDASSFEGVTRYGGILKSPDRKEIWLTLPHAAFSNLTWCRNVCSSHPLTSSAPLCWGTPLGITALRKKARFIPSVTHLCQLPLLPDEPFLTDEGLVHELSHLSGCCFTFLPSPCFTASASTLRFWPTHSQPPVVPQPPTTLPQESWGSTCHTTLIAQKYNGL